MTDTTLSQSVGVQRTSEIQDAYMAMTRTKRMYGGIMLVVFIALMASGFMLADSRNAGGFWDGILHIFAFPREVLTEAGEKAALIPALMLQFLPSMIETINIAAASTLVGGLMAIVLSLLSTRGLARFPRLIGLFRRMMDIMRAIPEIVIALVLIFVLGGGPVPAMIAIAFHTAGALGKLFSEVNENASLKPLEGLQSTGASWTQGMMLGIIPQVAPNWLSYALLRFEINIRASAILGFVGSGGIGYDLKNAFSWGQGRYDEVAAIFLLLFLTIVFFDQLSSHYRNKLAGKV
ncbi:MULTISPECIES: phosphonate ABC transporter, permease protein PhnE [Roseobacteraceae]|jgi:phosphonate transport system permease protein|uniref:Phosphate-import permease protein PhnE n=1 Tax=Pseudosulfitobacter pseudonitzschiae TaxID=1402135 RepID=A0A221K027_9RHOB|nr:MULTISPECIES: phosphonate ABC transporter, permease protein PhnE [Roseobacteraceae]ASM72197.1 phosphate-import permease protein PhnE [Pseudosulfitobacter pseudonitzschiae]